MPKSQRKQHHRKKIIVGMNGFGRFGLHLLKYWLDRPEAGFVINHINDDFFDIDQALNIILNDRAVLFNKYKVSINGHHLVFLSPDGREVSIEYTFGKREEIPWIGTPDVVFECSGKSTLSRDCAPYITGNTKLVIISATSWDSDATLVYGFNHGSFKKDLRIVSYGSCTVNAYVPLANFIHKAFGLINSDVNVIHNIQSYRLPDYYTLNRKFCTLEKSAPNLLPFLNENNFIVNYTVIPYDGVSTIDFRFKIKSPLSKNEIIEKIEQACSEGDLKGLYSLEEKDVGPEVNNCTTYSAVLVKDNIKLVGDNLYIFSYFDNENSANRYFDLVNYISVHL